MNSKYEPITDAEVAFSLKQIMTYLTMVDDEDFDVAETCFSEEQFRRHIAYHTLIVDRDVNGGIRERPTLSWFLREQLSMDKAFVAADERERASVVLDEDGNVVTLFGTLYRDTSEYEEFWDEFGDALRRRRSDRMEQMRRF